MLRMAASCLSATVPAAGRSGLPRPDGTHQVQATSLSGSVVGCPRWSPDNRYIAFSRLTSGHERIVVMKCQAGSTAKCEQPVPLTASRDSDPFSETRPCVVSGWQGCLFLLESHGKRRNLETVVATGAAPPFR